MPRLPSTAVQGSVCAPRAPALFTEERHSGYLNVVSDCVSVCILILSKARYHPLTFTQCLHLLLFKGIFVPLSSYATPRDLSIFFLFYLSVRDHKTEKDWTENLISFPFI